VIEQILQADRMLQVDQVRQAREIYQRVVELDPTNAIATVGLAECALADGDDAEAYALASKALSIDPQNDKARRMEARLSEIMAMRGESVERPAAAATTPAHEMRPVVTPQEPSAADPSPTAPPAPTPATAPAVPETAAGKPAMRRRSFVDRLLGR
jgi:tetratricopeptide (TPR) repeat protein